MLNEQKKLKEFKQRKKKKNKPNSKLKKQKTCWMKDVRVKVTEQTLKKKKKEQCLNCKKEQPSTFTWRTNLNIHFRFNLNNNWKMNQLFFWTISPTNIMLSCHFMKFSQYQMIQRLWKLFCFFWLFINLVLFPMNYIEDSRKQYKEKYRATSTSKC